MLCEVCGKNQATFFYKQTKNGYSVEKNLCSDCAKKQGLSVGSAAFDFDGFGDDFFGGFLGSFLEQKPHIVASETCRKCGMTLGELLHGGRVGCAECYTMFRKNLLPTVTKIHGNVAHCGKRPPETEIQNEPCNDTQIPPEKETPQPPSAPETSEQRLETLKKLIRKAIDEQEYEDAAKYRDEIRAIEAEIEKENGAEKGEQK